jgi:plasmid stability protein
MPSLTIKDIPEDVLEKLRERAERERRSLTKEALYLLEKAVEAPSKKSDRVSEQVSAWRQLGSGWSDATDEEVDDIYDARSEGRDYDW